MNQNLDIKKAVQDEIVRFNKSGAFTSRVLTDTPTDALSTVNRKFVTLNGATGSRPPVPVTGQFYFDTTLSRPVWWNGTNWIKADGTVV